MLKDYEEQLYAESKKLAADMKENQTAKSLDQVHDLQTDRESILECLVDELMKEEVAITKTKLVTKSNVPRKDKLHRSRMNLILKLLVAPLRECTYILQRPSVTSKLVLTI